jgi:hypothetical protein
MYSVQTYHAYGLNISSAVPLPELNALAEVEADVEIRVGRIDWNPSKSRHSDRVFEVTEGGTYLYWEPVGKFLVRGGNRILIDPLPGVEDRLLRLPLLGSVLAVLLHQRGYFVLHASAVSVGGHAAAFVGEKGFGKSTMAGAMCRGGHILMADDVVALDLQSPGGPVLISGFPQLKLWPDAATSLGDDPELLPEIAAGVVKRTRKVFSNFSPTSRLPLKGVYVLGISLATKIERLAPPDAMLKIIANSYIARMGRQFLQGGSASLHLNQCAAVVNSTPVWRLERPQDLTLLSDIAAMVGEHVASL